jgi:transposase
MTVQWKEASDRERVLEAVAVEKRAVQRDRYRVVLLAGPGDQGQELTREQIAAMAGRSRQFVDQWVGRYRRGGLERLRPAKRPGRKPKLTGPQVQQLKERLQAGPTEQDGIGTFHGKDICRLIEQEFGVVHTLGGIYDVLKRIGYSSLKPRPRHPKNDPKAMEAFQASAPFLSRR